MERSEIDAAPPSGTAHYTTPIDVARELHESRARLLDSWMARVVRELAAAAHFDRDALIDALPRLLDDLEETIRRGTRYESHADHIGAEHGAHRADVTVYDLDAVLVEYRILRRLIFEHLQKKRARLPHALANAIHDTLDRAQANAAAAFLRFRSTSEQQEHLLEETRKAVVFEQQLVGIVSHDLRTPLAAITMACSLLSSAPELSESSRRTVARITRAADRATRMIRDLLDLTQARLGRGLPLDRRRCALDKVMRQVLDEIHTSFPDRTIAVDVDANIAEGEWDPDRIAQVISNLVDNALAHSPVESVVRLRAAPDDHDKQNVTLEIHNEGAGIPPNLLPRLFEPLERSAEAPRKAGGRTIGLGLFITKQIVEAHAGTIEVRSDATHGTTVRVTLPRISS